VDIPSFLRRFPPFDDLADEDLAEIVAHCHIEFHPAGATILQQGGEPARQLSVVRTGAVEMLDDGQVLDLLTEGEVFGHASLLSGQAPTLTVRAYEDTIVYLIDEEQARRVLSTRAGLTFVSASLRRRVVRALEGLDPQISDPWQTPVGSLIRRPPVQADPSLPVREAARLMTDQRVSSLLIPGADGAAIVTDRDLRSRVLAAGLTADVTLVEIATSPVITAPAATMVAEVLAMMLERGVHHVPVTDPDGRIVGMVTDTDLMGHERTSPFVLKVDIERSATAEQVVAAARRLPETVAALVDASVDPIDVGHVVGVTIDTLTRRLLQLGIDELGDPPCPWSWVAFGSEARLEQALATDQDNALVIDPGELPFDQVDPYFERLARSVNDRIDDAGIPKCRAGVIASNRLCRDTPAGWGARFERGIREGDWAGGVLGAIGFDVRSIAGPLEPRPVFDDAIRRASGDQHFVRRLTSTTVKEQAPTGFTRAAVIHLPGRTTDMLDLKQGGITLITSIARVYAVLGGATEIRTLQRLRLAATRDLLTEDARLGLEESFRLLWQTRLEHQVRRFRAGEEPDDLLDPRSLGPLARQGLKHAFRTIDQAQSALAGLVGVRR
jgi:CBS domain-containing protein